MILQDCPTKKSLPRDCAGACLPAAPVSSRTQSWRPHAHMSREGKAFPVQECLLGKGCPTRSWRSADREPQGWHVLSNEVERIAELVVQQRHAGELHRRVRTYLAEHSYDAYLPDATPAFSVLLWRADA